jgi:hypothetical protein
MRFDTLTLVVISFFALWFAAMAVQAMRTGIFNLKGGAQVQRNETPLNYWFLVGFFAIVAMGILGFVGFTAFGGHL